MKSDPKKYSLTVIALVTGLIVLSGYFFSPMRKISGLLLEWSMIFVSVLLLVGVISLVQNHWKKIRNDAPNRSYSLVLVISFFLTLAITAAFGPTSNWSLWIFNHVIIPIEGSLLALMSVVLIFACVRMFNQRLSIFTLLFIGTVLLSLVGSVVLPGLELVILRDIKNWLANVWVVGGMRGILLGVGLGTLAAGLRVIMGTDRPYGG